MKLPNSNYQINKIQNQNFELAHKVEVFLLEIIPVLRHFPKIHKHTFGEKIELASIELAELVFFIQYVPESRPKKIMLANMKIQVMVLFIRLAQKLNCISFKQYQYFVSNLIEMGKILSKLKKVYAAN